MDNLYYLWSHFLKYNYRPLSAYLSFLYKVL
jgi:hypothetical protein